MPQILPLSDRIRIERTVSLLDTYLSDLPRKSRVAKRREVRANLRDAAADVGTAEALRNLGSPRRLAAGYLAAEFGDWQPRPSWTSGFFCGALVLIAAETFVHAMTTTYGDGLLAADPHIAGTVQWRGIPYVSSQVTYIFADGKASTVGGAWTPWVYVAIVAAFVLGGRIWRLLPAWRRRHSDIGDDL